MYKSIFETKTYTQICQAVLSDNPKQNMDFRDEAKKLNLKKDIVSPLTILEDHFVGASVCYKRLRSRSEEYKLIVDNHSPGFIMRSPLLKELHAYEYFFFCCCGYIYKELNHEIQNSNLKIPQLLLDKLFKLKEERRVREHGKDWFWGESGRIIPTKGDNYNFEANMQLLDDIYAKILGQLGL